MTSPDPGEGGFEALPTPSEPTDRPATVGSVAAGFWQAYRSWIVGAAALLALVLFLLWGANQPDDPQPTASGGAPSVTPSTPADGLDFAEVVRQLGEECWRLLLAETSEQRQSGLRFRESELDRVDGMLFAFDEPVPGGSFTMSGVVEPLEIGFYDGDGHRLGGHVMEPCEGTIVECPGYAVPSGSQYAIETRPGELPAGDLGGECEGPPA